MSRDLKIDLTTGDLVVEDGDLLVLDGIDQIVQNIHIVLKFYFREWYLNQDLGVRYFEEILIKNPNVPRVDTLIKSAIAGVEGVNQILYYKSDYDNVTREFTVDFQVDTAEGTSDTETATI